MIIGVDVGTTVTKAALIGRDGRSHAMASQPSRLVRMPDGRVEQDLDDVVGSVAAVVRDVAAAARAGSPAGGAAGEAIEAVAVTGQGDGLWLRDAAGAAVRPPISWMDARAADLVADWGVGGADSVVSRIFRLTGSGIFPGSHAGILAALARDEPESLDRAAVAGYCNDAILQRLTGDISVDASDASLPFLNVRTRQYVDEALELCGIGEYRQLLAAPAEPHAMFALDSRGAELLGLPVGTPVTAGPYDLQACGFGCGTTRAGDGTLVVGTTLSSQVLTSDAEIPRGAEPAGMWLCTPDPELFLRVMPSMVGTASIDWLLGLFGLAAKDLGDVLEASVPGANGVRALSFLSPSGERAPFVDPFARGQFTGLQLGTGRADIIRALCESIAYVARQSFELMGLTGELSACGGGMRSDAWAQLIADVIGTPLYLPLESEVGVRGAARVAWDALGEPVDATLWRSQRRVIEPRSGAKSRYGDGYARYLDDLSTARAAWVTA